MVLRNLLFVLSITVSLQVFAVDATRELPLEVKRWLAAGDTKQAIPWLVEASEEGNAEAAFTLGKLYRLGKGAPRDLRKSAKYLEIAARHNFVEAQYLLGLHYDKEGDRAAAQEWFIEAAGLGHKRAADRISHKNQMAGRDVFDLIDHKTPKVSGVGELDWSLVNGEGESTLMHAVKIRKTKWVVYLASAGVGLKVSQRDKLGNTALHYAAKSGSRKLIKPLLDAGADPNNGNARGSTSLHFAVAGGHQEAARLLLQHGADANIKDKNDWSPSMLAERSEGKSWDFIAKHRTKARVKKVGQSVDIKSDLFRTVRHGDQAQVANLLKSGIEVNVSDASGTSLLSMAIQRGDTAIVSLLLNSGARLEADPSGDSSLVQAIKQNNGRIVKLLVDLGSGAGAEDLDAKGWRPIHHAVTSDCVECFEELVRAGVDVGKQTNRGDTPLVLAARTGQEVIGLRLVSLASNVDAVDSKGRSALWWSVEKKLSRLGLELIQKGAAQIVDQEGIGPLHLAVESENTDLFDALLNGSTPLDLQSKSPSGSTPLLLAAYHNNAHAIQRLIDGGVDIDQQNLNGDTALMLAVGKKNLSSATVLVQAGASLNRRNEQNNSARSMMEQIDDAAWSHLLESAPSELESLFERLTSR